MCRWLGNRLLAFRAAPACAGAGGASAQPLARGPAFAAVAGGHLYGVRCTSAADCWAVGDTGANLTEALHWDGHTWSQVATPSPYTGQGFNELQSVTCISATDC